MPKPTPIGIVVWRRISGIFVGDRRDVEAGRAGDALQAHVIEVARRGASPRPRCAHRSTSARAGRCTRSGASQGRGELLGLLRRVVDDEHAVDAGIAERGRRARRGRRGDTPAVRTDWHSPSARPAWRRRRGGTRARSRAWPRARRRSRIARSVARWIVGPSADGSENGTPSSMTSAPARASACIRATSSSADGSPAAM